MKRNFRTKDLNPFCIEIEKISSNSFVILNEIHGNATHQMEINQFSCVTLDKMRWKIVPHDNLPVRFAHTVFEFSFYLFCFSLESHIPDKWTIFIV